MTWSQSTLPDDTSRSKPRYLKASVFGVSLAVSVLGILLPSAMHAQTITNAEGSNNLDEWNCVAGEPGPSGQETADCDLDGKVRVTGNIVIDAADQSDALTITTGSGSLDRGLVVNTAPGALSGIDVRKPDTRGNYMRFLGANGRPFTQIGDGGQFETVAWMVISGQIRDVGPNRYFLHPIDRPFMLGVYSDILGPTGVFRSNFYSENENAWPLSLISGAGQEVLRVSNAGDIMMGSIAADPHVPGEQLQLRLTRVGDVGFQARSNDLARYGPGFFQTELDGYYGGTASDGSARSLLRYEGGTTVAIGTGRDPIVLDAGTGPVRLRSALQLHSVTSDGLTGVVAEAGSLIYCSNCTGGQVMLNDGAQWRAIGSNPAALTTAMDPATAGQAMATMTMAAAGVAPASAGVVQTTAGTVAIGNEATATHGQATAIGERENARSGSVTLGANAVAEHANSAAVGPGAVTTVANQVMLGGKGSAVVIADVAASTAAQNEQVKAVTVDSHGVLGTSAIVTTASVDNVRVAIDRVAEVSDQQFGALSSRVDTLGGRVDTLFDLTNTIGRDAKRGIASVAAAAHPHFPSAAGKTSYASNVALYRGEVGFAAGMMHRLDADIAITAGVSFAGGNSTAVRAGIAGEF